MKIAIILILSSITTIQSCNAQPSAKTTEVYNDKFKWRITVPESFENVPPAQWRKIQNNGQEEIEKTYDSKMENISKIIFAFKSEQLNYFESNYQPFDSIRDGEYLASFRKINRMLCGTFEAQIPDAKLDSVSSKEIVDGLTFQTFKLIITYPNKIVMDFWMFSRLFGKNEFTVNIMTVDKTKQGLLLSAWRNSKFGVN